MASKKVCTGEIREWEPVWVQGECGECGAPSGEKYDSEIPDFHDFDMESRVIDGVKRWFCTGCKVEMVGVDAMNLDLEERMLPAIMSSIEHNSPMLDYLKSGKKFNGGDMQVPFTYEVKN
jgi:hypothetical protein